MKTPAELAAIFERIGVLNVPVIHIAGSKGKGSTAHLLAAFLQKRGCRVGLFSSPALLDEREMIRINGKWISEEDWNRLHAFVRKRVADLGEENLSPFEVTNMAAFLYFEESGCDYVVLEAGWGGAKDATNLLSQKALTILTHVELEHTAVLGSTLEEITREKLGICREGTVLLTALDQKAEVKEAIESVWPEAIFVKADSGHGRHHPETLALVEAAAGQLGFEVSSDDLEWLREHPVEGRFEMKGFGPHTIIFDGAHTPDSVDFVLQQIQRWAEKEGKDFDEIFWAIHFLKDKKADLWQKFPAERTVWIPLENERAGLCPEGLAALDFEEWCARLREEKTPQIWVLMGSFKLYPLFKRLFESID